MNKERSNPSIPTSLILERFLTVGFALLAVFCEPSHADSNCRLEEILRNLKGARFLHQRNPSLHMTAHVDRTQQLLRQLGVENAQNPEKKIAAWLHVLERTHLGRQPKALAPLKQHYYGEKVIRPEAFPEGYFELQRRIAREQGRGDIQITPAMRAELTRVAIEDQKTSLDEWIEYLVSEDTKHYPMWAKVWAFEGMTKLAKLDPATGRFATRRADTVAPFVDLNREALGIVMDAIVRKVEGRPINDISPELAGLLEGAHFGKLYAQTVRILGDAQVDLAVTTGQWVKYPKKSDPAPLVQSLQCRNTGWCTAGASTAAKQLENGDFHVYYSNDSLGRPKQPRIAIRMEGSKIAEVRGIAETQNLDAEIVTSGILESKLDEFGEEGKKYVKRTAQMSRLTEIEKRAQTGQALSREDLRFLLELDEKIEGFGYRRDPRVDEILKGRDRKSDLSQALGSNISPEEISLTEREVLRSGIRYHHGNLGPFMGEASVLQLPEMVHGNVGFWGIKSARGVRLPRIMNGTLNLRTLTSIEGLALPEILNGDLVLSALRSVEGLELPRQLNGHLILDGLKSVSGLKLPEHFRGGISLDALHDAKGLRLPEEVFGSLTLTSLRTAQGLVLPEIIHGSLRLDTLLNTDGLRLPREVRGHLSLGNIRSAQGLQLPEVVRGDLDLHMIPTAVGIDWPREISGKIFLHGLKTAEGLKLPSAWKDRVVLPKGIEPEWINP